MSTLWPSGVLVHQETTENSEPAGIKKMKADENQGKLVSSKRAALGTITNTTRVQPFRAAKQGTCVAGEQGFLSLGTQFDNATRPRSAFAASAQPSTFTVFEDDKPQENQPLASLPSAISLHPSITSLRHPLTQIQDPIIIIDSPTQESPMVLDNSALERYSFVEEPTPEEQAESVLCAAEYADQIYEYLLEAEQRNRPKPSYMKKQPDITESMRCILIDWLVEVAEEYKLHRETLCLAINYIDRFLSQMSVLRGKLQLVGAASMFLAAKYEEIYPPEVGEFVYITDETYTKKQVLRMEHLILKVLSFDVAVPTLNCFAETYLKNLNIDSTTESLAWYLMEMTLIEVDPYLKFLPSVIAASAICLACHTRGLSAWQAKVSSVTQYPILSLRECIQALFVTFHKAAQNPQQAIREKYKQDRFHRVGLLDPPTTLPRLDGL